MKRAIIITIACLVILAGLAVIAATTAKIVTAKSVAGKLETAVYFYDEKGVLLLKKTFREEDSRCGKKQILVDVIQKCKNFDNATDCLFAPGDSVTADSGLIPAE